MKVLIAGGGTGGHLYPGIALAQELQRKNNTVLFIIRTNHKEQETLEKYKIDYRTISTIGLKRKISWQILIFLVKLTKGMIESLKIIKEFKPEVMVGMGGYLSLPSGIAAWLKKIPLVIHEQNCLPGKATRLLAPISKKIALSFESSLRYLDKYKAKIVITGNPLREEMVIIKENRKKDLWRKGLLVFGGSQGAHSINMAMIAALDFLEPIRKKISIVHLTGNNDFAMVEEGYREENFEVTVSAYHEQMQELYAQADLVVCRAGATTLAELALWGLPAILIPYPYATCDHQKINAEVFDKQGASIIILNQDLTGEKLAQNILCLLQDEKRLKEMAQKAQSLAKPQARDEMVKVINTVTNKAL